MIVGTHQCVRPLHRVFETNGSPSPRGKASNKVKSIHIVGIVGGFLGDLNIVGMALSEARAGDADKLCLLVKVGDSRAAGVAHASLQAAHKLINSVGQHSLVGYASFDAFGDELSVARLEVAVGAALAHSSEAAHTAVDLELSALIYLLFAGAFLAARDQRA